MDITIESKMCLSLKSTNKSSRNVYLIIGTRIDRHVNYSMSELVDEKSLGK